ncbi:hypothetical protein ACJX0J_024701, partial [Zea mays]
MCLYVPCSWDVTSNESIFPFIELHPIIQHDTLTTKFRRSFKNITWHLMETSILRILLWMNDISMFILQVQNKNRSKQETPTILDLRFKNVACQDLKVFFLYNNHVEKFWIINKKLKRLIYLENHRKRFIKELSKNMINLISTPFLVIFMQLKTWHILK